METHFFEDTNLYASGISEEALEGKIVFSHGEDCYLYDMNGKKYLDFSTGIFTNSLGQCNKRLVQAQTIQLQTLGNIHDFPCTKRLELLNLLNSITPKHINNFSFASTGAEALEIGLRALYTYINDENMEILTFKNSYHGKTGGIRLLLNWRYRSEPYKEPVQVDFPTCSNCPFNKNQENCNFECAKNIAKTIEKNPNIKAFLFEPILGAGGIHVPPPKFWKITSEICKKNNVLMIDDEIFMSGGRIGTFFACDYYGIDPDMILISKGISSGYPFSVVAARKEILSNKYFSNPGDVSSTYASTPLGIITALETIKIIQEEKLIENVNNLEPIISTNLNSFKNTFSFLSDVRHIGLIFALEFSSYNNLNGNENAKLFFHKCLENGLKVSLGGNIIRMCPPLNIDEHKIITAFEIMNKVLLQIKKGEN